MARFAREMARARRRGSGRGLMQMNIDGAKELEAALRALPQRLSRPAMRRAILQTLEPIADEAKRKVQEDSGALSENIHVSSKLSRRQRRARRQVHPKPWVEGFVGAGPSRHAHLVEFGTGPRYTKDGWFTGAARPFPFMRPAWERGKQAALDRFGAELGREIEKTAARLARRQRKAMRGK